MKINVNFVNVQCFFALERFSSTMAFRECCLCFFWLEDDDADAIESDAGQIRLDPKSRETAELVFSCEVPFTELRQHFQWAPTGFTRQ